MKAMFISDLHYSIKPFHGRDESKAFDWVYDVIKKEKPVLLISAGDFGKEASLEMFQPILDQTRLLTIYGNHDNVELIKRMRNRNGSTCWLQDGLLREYGQLKIAGISGNIAMKKRKIHHKTVEEVKEIFQRVVEKSPHTPASSLFSVLLKVNKDKGCEL